MERVGGSSYLTGSKEGRKGLGKQETWQILSAHSAHAPDDELDNRRHVSSDKLDSQAALRESRLSGLLFLTDWQRLTGQAGSRG